MKKVNKVYTFLIYILPVVLFFSYYPIISFGRNESMNFEISLPLIWLVVFDVLAFGILVKKKLWRRILEKWQWLLLPIFMSFSVLWSPNLVRGILTMGILWLICFAVFMFVILKKEIEFPKNFKEVFWKVFFGSSLAICAWCVLQCILDVLGVPRDCTLMCKGCVSQAFGFPHPNGFAIEPQFMGNLLIAPIIMSLYFLKQNSKNLGRKFLLFCFFIFTATLFLTFSRGAIYACLVGLIFLTTWQIVRTKKWKVILIWPIIILAFLFTLNLQGIFAEVGPTNDTYTSGVAKVLNHLSLGIIDVHVKGDLDLPEVSGKTQVPSLEQKNEVENEADFDGYVEESTEVRKKLTRDAIKVWSQDFKTTAFGVGLGGAGEALYDVGLTGSPKEIVQNEYASLLLEVGVVGVILVILTVVLVTRTIIKSSVNVAIVTLLIAYGITLCFFSGLPNALHIYLLPALFYVIF
ncbi:O-antigen ligase family protein [Candidatus Saccharibacteria bacterium]|nr:O-antigen ligase family protein [Candidatus Saccharibacteria bacterium]